MQDERCTWGLTFLNLLAFRLGAARGVSPVCVDAERLPIDAGGLSGPVDGACGVAVLQTGEPSAGERGGRSRRTKLRGHRRKAVRRTAGLRARPETARRARGPALQECRIRPSDGTR